MEEAKASTVVEQLRARGVMAHLERSGVYQFGIRVVLPGGVREAIWDADGTAGLEAQILEDGDLVGFVPEISGSEEFSVEQVVAAIAGADYDAPLP